MFTQEKRRPALGGKAEKSSVSMDAAITQWNILAGIECRGTISGTQGVICSGTGPAGATGLDRK